jgi:hypothetical protein
MGAMKPNQKFNRKLNIKLRSIEITEYVGRDKFEDFITATIIDLNVGLTPKSTFQFKLPYVYAFSRLENTNGLGDISLSYSRNILAKEKYQLNATIGCKIPTGDADVRAKDGRPLPMYIQPTLGTIDLVAGASMINRGWLFAVGYQKVIANLNRNEFIWEKWADHPDPVKRELGSDRLHGFPQSRLIQRRADVMARIERNQRFSKFNIHAGLLLIHRFNQDQVNRPNPQSGVLEEVKVVGSNGSALSLIVGVTYHFSIKSSLKLLFGDRLLERDRNPDGLSREQVWTLGYQYNF